MSAAALDRRLDSGAIVLGLEIDGSSRAYDLQTQGDGIIMGTLGGTKLILFSSEEGPARTAYGPVVDSPLLTLFYDKGLIGDEETGPTWTMAGEAVAWGLDCRQLEQLPARSTFWFSHEANDPGVETFGVEYVREMSQI